MDFTGIIDWKKPVIIKGHINCSNWPRGGKRCERPAEVAMLSPSGDLVPGGYECRACAERSAAEYREKLGEVWQIVSLVEGPAARHGNDVLGFPHPKYGLQVREMVKIEVPAWETKYAGAVTSGIAEAIGRIVKTAVRISVYGYAVELSGPAIPDRHKFNCFGCTIYRATQDIIVHPYDAKTRLVQKIEALTHAAPFTTPFSFYFPVPVHFLREE